MAVSESSFGERILKIEEQRSSRVKNGYIHEMRADGLIVARPRAYKPSFPFRGLLMVAVCFLLFKTLIVISVDEVTYDRRMDTLQSGTMAERVGAYLMQDDPVTSGLAEFLLTQADRLIAALD